MKTSIARLICLVAGLFFIALGGGLLGGRVAAQRLRLPVSSATGQLAESAKMTPEKGSLQNQPLAIDQPNPAPVPSVYAPAASTTTSENPNTGVDSHSLHSRAQQKPIPAPARNVSSVKPDSVRSPESSSPPIKEAAVLEPAAAASAGIVSRVASPKYVIQAISTSSQADASAIRKKILNEGFAAGVFEADLREKGKWYRVYVGPYDNEAEAKQALEAIRKVPGFSGSFVKPLE